MNTCFRIKELRLKAELTQKGLAKKLGFQSASTITMWESGDRTPKSEILPALATALNCEINDLYTKSQPVIDTNTNQTST